MLFNNRLTLSYYLRYMLKALCTEVFGYNFCSQSLNLKMFLETLFKDVLLYLNQSIKINNCDLYHNNFNRNYYNHNKLNLYINFWINLRNKNSTINNIKNVSRKSTCTEYLKNDFSFFSIIQIIKTQCHRYSHDLPYFMDGAHVHLSINS